MTTEFNNEIVPLRQLNRLSEPRVFSHEEALELVSLLMIITSKTKKELNNFNAQLAYFKNRQDKATELQDKINQSMQTWSEKIRRLGAIPVSLCKVKIPGEDGQYYWEYPEPKLYLQ
ncbi:MAG: hypothetical protein K2P81_02780 [Bacteriovoracaceae bacterium]|nr:hypothetical protein [Bacteriovoracaceae bacterium]